MTQRMREAGFDLGRITQIVSLIVLIVGGAFYLAPVRGFAAEIVVSRKERHELDKKFAVMSEKITSIEKNVTTAVILTSRLETCERLVLDLEKRIQKLENIK